MFLGNLKVATQLRLGLGVILVLVVALGAVAWRQADLLWQQTRTMYEHPLPVRTAVGNLEVDVEILSRHVRGLLLARNAQEAAAALQGIELAKKDAEQQLVILSDAYLGPPADVTRAQDEFSKWNVIRDETVRLLRAEPHAVAEDRIRSGGVQETQAEVVRGALRTIDDFARNKTDQLYRAAAEEKELLNQQLAAIIAAMLLFILFISWRLLKTIRDPLKQLTASAEQFRLGKMDARSGYVSANEFGALAAAFDTMADAIQTETRMSENAAQLAGVMLREEEAHGFCRELLAALLQHTGSQVGAVYFLNEAKTVFEHFESIGLGARGRAAFSALDLEGELGAAVATRRIGRITDIPADTRFAFAAVSGDFMPREILTIPVPSDHHVSAVISLASIRAYDAASIRLVNDVWAVLTARVNLVLAFRQVTDLAEGLEHQNRELDAQKRELAAQANELTEQNTELEMQKDQLTEANRLKSAFLSNMSHELRTPLNSVIALSGVLSRRLDRTIPEEELGYLEVIERNGRNLLLLINDILDLSRIEAGREDFSLVRFSVRVLVGEVVAMVEPQAREKDIGLHNLVGDDLPEITSDPAKCRHILQNLVANAVKFTATGGVEISARLVGDEVHVAVRDTGIGIAADQLPHIFEEFRQADDSTSRRFGGTGLGLAIAERYATLLRGGVTVQSTPGTGSTFTLRLPLVLELPDVSPSTGADRPSSARAGEPNVERDGGQAPAPPGREPCILLVEDSEPVVIQMTDILVGQGYRLQVARDGHDALAQIEQIVPDAVILDLMMPAVDGFQVLKAIRGLERTSRVPVLILTAKHVTKEELSFLEGNGIHQLIQKGDVSKAEILAAVARMVAPPRAEPARPVARTRRPTRPGPPVVLVVDDNPDNVRTLKALLSDAYHVIEAEDGRAALDQARRHRPDVILMDIAMPVMDGVQALQEVRRDETIRHIPVIAVTASAMVGDRETILSHGFDGYLSKPFDVDLLKHTLQQALD